MRIKKEAVPASILKRIIAFILDILILNIIVIMPFSGLLRGMVPSGDFNEMYKIAAENMDSLMLLFFFIGLLALLYFSLLEWKLGQSIGKMLVNVKVVAVDGSSPVFWQCLGRSLFVFPFLPFILLWIIDPISIYLNPRKQRLSEFLTKTMVVDE